MQNRYSLLNLIDVNKLEVLDEEEAVPQLKLIIESELRIRDEKGGLSRITDLCKKFPFRNLISFFFEKIKGNACFLLYVQEILVSLISGNKKNQDMALSFIKDEKIDTFWDEINEAAIHQGNYAIVEFLLDSNKIRCTEYQCKEMARKAVYHKQIDFLIMLLDHPKVKEFRNPILQYVCRYANSEILIRFLSLHTSITPKQYFKLAMLSLGYENEAEGLLLWHEGIEKIKDINIKKINLENILTRMQTYPKPLLLQRVIHLMGSYISTEELKRCTNDAIDKPKIFDVLLQAAYARIENFQEKTTLEWWLDLLKNNIQKAFIENTILLLTLFWDKVPAVVKGAALVVIGSGDDKIFDHVLSLAPQDILTHIQSLFEGVLAENNYKLFIKLIKLHGDQFPALSFAVFSNVLIPKDREKAYLGYGYEIAVYLIHRFSFTNAEINTWILMACCEKKKNIIVFFMQFDGYLIQNKPIKIAEPIKWLASLLGNKQIGNNQNSQDADISSVVEAYKNFALQLLANNNASDTIDSLFTNNTKLFQKVLILAILKKEENFLKWALAHRPILDAELIEILTQLGADDILYFSNIYFKAPREIEPFFLFQYFLLKKLPAATNKNIIEQKVIRLFEIIEGNDASLPGECKKVIFLQAALTSENVFNYMKMNNTFSMEILQEAIACEIEAYLVDIFSTLQTLKFSENIKALNAMTQPEIPSNNESVKKVREVFLAPHPEKVLDLKVCNDGSIKLDSESTKTYMANLIEKQKRECAARYIQFWWKGRQKKATAQLDSTYASEATPAKLVK